jgi:putative PIN family toxin of toxin-antitoxin system
LRNILDTNILVSALIVPGGHPDYLYQCWRTGRFRLISSEEQIDEFRRVTRYPRLRKYIRPAAAGTMLNEIRALAELTGPLPLVTVCSDPADNFLLSMAEVSKADCLITGDGRHLLTLGRHGGTRIITAREAADLLG